MAVTQITFNRNTLNQQFSQLYSRIKRTRVWQYAIAFRMIK